MSSACNKHHSGAPAWLITPLIHPSLTEHGPQSTCYHSVPTSHSPCGFQGIDLLSSMKLSPMRRELPPGVTVILLTIKRKKGQAGSFTARGDTLQMSPPACFTARLHYSIRCGKANQTPSCRLGSDPARAPHMHSGEGEVSSRRIKQVPDGTTGHRHRRA